MSAGDVYVKGIYDRYSHFATWLPNSPIMLGDVGILDGKYFKRATSLRELKIPFDVRSGAVPLEYSYSSQASVKVETGASGQVSAAGLPPLADAGITVEFGGEGAFVFQAAHCVVDEIENRLELAERVIRLFKQGKWDTDWAVVSTVVKAGNATILVSKSSGSQLQLSAAVDSSAIGSLADPKLGLKVRSERGEVLRFLAEPGITPMFNLSRIKRSLLKTLIGSKKSITFGGKTKTNASRLPEDEEKWEAVEPE